MKISNLNQHGAIFALTLIALTSVLVITIVLISSSFTFKQSSRYSLDNLEAISLAEAGIDKAIASLNKNPQYNGESETHLGNGSYSVSVATIGPGVKEISAIGYIPNKENPKTKSKASVQISQGIGASFNYGVQVGEGGLEFGNGNVVNGSIYSNGSIIASGNNNLINGDAWVAGGQQSVPDQQTDCTGINCTSYIFGKNVSGESRIDVAQSFTAATSGVLNKASFKLRKIGNPTDATVRLITDNGGKPNKNNVLTSGSLYNNLITSNYGWTEVTFNSSIPLIAGNTYWLIISTDADSSNYWDWQLDSLQSYTRGVARWSSNWQAGNPSWNAINGDLSFTTSMGGVETRIQSMGSNFSVTADVHAHKIDGITISKDAYYQSITNSTVAGVSNPGSADPPPKIFPISDSNISEWKTQARSGGIISNSVTNCQSALGPVKIEGDLTFNSNCTVTINSPIWITGNLNLNSNNKLTLNSNYGNASGLIIVDGQVTIGSNNKLEGSGVGSSILMILSNYDSRTSGVSAIVVNNEGNNGVYYAKDGVIEPGNKNSYTELTAWGIKLINNSTLNYKTGLSSTIFSAGPSGSFSVIKGTYQIK
jgi:hypothetical protein